MTEPTSTLQRIIWIFPDRESTRTNAKWNASFWQDYREVAKEIGLTYERTAPEAVTVDALDVRNPKVYVDGERVHAHEVLFVTSPYTLPYQIMDAFNQFTLYSVLETAGFYLPHPASFAPIGNDKLATLLFFKDCPVPPIPTVRITAGRDLLTDDFLSTIENLPYPAFVKPSGWMAARGINLAHSANDVRGLLSLAQGGDTTLVFQPYLGEKTIDYRVHVIDGKPSTTLVRVAGAGTIFPQYSTGAQAYYTEMPAELAPAIEYLVEKLPIPYFCADFLHDGEQFWLSEIEPDGAIFAPDHAPEVVKMQRDLIRDRFEAYRKAHARLFGSAE